MELEINGGMWRCCRQGVGISLVTSCITFAVPDKDTNAMAPNNPPLADIAVL